MSNEYGMNDLQFGKGLLCTQSNEDYWTEGKIYPLSKGLSIQDDDKDVTWYSNEVLMFLNSPNSNRAFDLISLDTDGVMLNKEDNYTYTVDDIYDGMILICESSQYPHWTEGKEYIVEDGIIKDNYGENRDVVDIVKYLNGTMFTLHRLEFKVKNTTLNDEINIDAPNYYTGGIETKDYIRSHDLNFNRGSAVKYATRAGKKDKDKEIEDLKKAINFLQFEIDYLENGIANIDDYANNGVWEGLK